MQPSTYHGRLARVKSPAVVDIHAHQMPFNFKILNSSPLPVPTDIDATHLHDRATHLILCFDGN